MWSAEVMKNRKCIPFSHLSAENRSSNAVSAKRLGISARTLTHTHTHTHIHKHAHHVIAEGVQMEVCGVPRKVTAAQFCSETILVILRNLFLSVAV